MSSDGKCYETLIDSSGPSEAPQWLINLVTKNDVPVPTPSPATDLTAFTKAAASHRQRNSNGVGYGKAALEAEIAKVANAMPGTRNHTLNASGFSLGQLVGGSALNEGEVK